MKTRSCNTRSISRHMPVCAAFAAALLFTSPARSDELITLQTRPGVSQSVLLWEPHAAHPETVILLFPGGPGNIGLTSKDGLSYATAPHLFSQQRDALLQEPYAVAVLDAPSDVDDMTQDFRMSAQHAVDVQAVVRELQSRFPKSRLVLVAHSRGTVSVGHVALGLPTPASAIVLLSGLYQASQPGPQVPSAGPGLSKVDFAALKAPLLVVHHAQDACPVAPFAATTTVAKQFPMITVHDSGKESKEPSCGPGGGHWFAGNEKAVGQEVLNWLSGKAWKAALP